MEAGSPSAKRRVLGVALTLLLLGGLYAIVSRAPKPSVAPEPQVAAAPEPQPQPEAPPEAPTAAPPSFDLVRVEPDGSAAVAGTAAPGSTVTIYADAAPLAEVEADAQGNFVAIFQVEPSAEPRSLTLGTVTPDGGEARSEDMVMLLPEAPPETAADAMGAPDAAPTVAAAAPEEVAPQAGSEAEAEVPAPEPAAGGAEPEVAATALISGDGVEVLPPTGNPGESRRVTLASISYAEAGTVTLAGVGTAGAVIRAYVDDSFASEGRVADDGRWRMELDDVAEGLYTLRIDQIAADGEVASRVETPFQRDFPRPPRPRPGVPAPVELGTGMVSVTVQPGHNLWTLARERYGSGIMYTQILTANQELIRNPDLIYPGQIFNLPDSAAE